MARILLAESDDRIRGFIAGILIEFGHDVASCADAAEAAEWLTTQHVDVVLTDLVLGNGQGACLGRKWAARGVPTITLSGQKFRADRAARHRLPALLEKPFRFADLQSVVDAVASYSVSEGSAAA
jgi:two-component system, cell cycle response regulator CpdR